MDKLLFIVCTHGNETAPLEVIKNVIKKYGEKKFYNNCDYIIANPKALKKNTRFTETDLNRIYPGNIKSEIYEEKRAAEILKYAKKFKFVIDIHTTVADSGIFTIVTKETSNNNKLASKLFPKRIVIWESVSGSKTGPITSFLDHACEIECSTSYSNHLEDLEKAILNAIDIFDKNTKEKEWYRVVDSMPEKEKLSFDNLKDFYLIKYNKKPMYPLLVRRYSEKACYLMEKINNPLKD